MKNVISFFSIPKWLFIVLIAVIILRVPSFFEPYSYGDEMIYLALGEGVRQGLTLFKDVHDNKPPLLYLTAAVAGNLFWFKAILLFWHLGSIFVFWKLVSVLFPKSELAQAIAVILLSIFTTIPLLEGTIVNAELFMFGPTCLAIYILLLKKSYKAYFLSGLILSIATLYKVPALFEIPAILLFILFTKKDIKKELVPWIKKSIVLGLGFLTPILISFIWYYFKGALNQYLIAAYLQNVGYVSSWRPTDTEKPFLVKNGPLLFRAGGVFLSTLIVFAYRKKMSKTFLLGTIWLIFGLFAVTLSERPYPHYLIQVVPPSAILFAIFFTSQKLEQAYTVIPLLLLFFVPFYYKFWHYKTLPYYTRFYTYSMQGFNNSSYLKSFGGEVPSTYTISEKVMQLTAPSDKVMVWGDRPAIYALSKRLPPIKYVAGYHISDFSSYQDLAQSLTESKPKLIVVLEGSPENHLLAGLLTNDYQRVAVVENSILFLKKD